MLSPKQQYAQFTVTQQGSIVNLTSPGLGSVTVNASSGAFALANAAGVLLTHSAAADTALVSWGGAAPAPAAARNDSCLQSYNNTDASSARRSALFPRGLKDATQASCCAACNSDSTCVAWVWAEAAQPDPTVTNCWPLQSLSGTVRSQGRVVGGAAPPPPPLPPAPSTLLTLATSPSARFLGSGNTGDTSNRLNRTSGQALVGNTATFTPSFYCTDGWGLMAVSPYLTAAGGGPNASSLYPVQWQTVRGGAGGVQLAVMGGTTPGMPVDFYFYIAPTLLDFVAEQSALQGRAAVPPRYAMGFAASRWGWTNQSYIEGVLQRFRDGSFPVSG